MGQKIYAILALVLFFTISFADTARRTGTSENVNTYGSAGQGRDYTAFSTWEAATDNNLVTSTTSEVLECYDDAASFDDAVELLGATTNSLYFRIIRAASNNGHDGTPSNGFTLDNSSSSVNTGGLLTVFGLGEDNSSIQDIIITSSYNSTNSYWAVVSVSSDNLVVAMLVYDYTNTGSGNNVGIRKDEGTGDFLCIISLVEDADGDGFQGASGTSYFYNCTSVSNGGDGFDNIGATVTVKNCLSSGSGGNDFDSGYTDSNNNASGDATAPGTSSRTSQTFTFVNAAGNDYHLASEDAGADNFGTDLSGDGTFAFGDDINDGVMGGSKSGELFNTWDIGFDENDPPAAAGGGKRGGKVIPVIIGQ